MSAVLRVLCVDDDEDVADSQAMLLRAAGYDARACYSGADALPEAAAFLPGVCVIDMDMPDGDELAEQLRASGAPPVLVAVTAVNDGESRRRVEDARFDLHQVKPVDPRHLLDVVGRLAGEKQPEP